MSMRRRNAQAAVSVNGRLDAVWYDTRNDPTPSDPTTSEVYYSYSLDAGETWSANVAVTPAFDHTIRDPSGKLGDYIHMVSDNVGANLAYAATFNGEPDIWFLRIGDYDCNGNGVGDTDDLAGGRSNDINRNEIPDECDCLGDLNGDFVVNADDLMPMLAGFGHCSGDDAFEARLDLDVDGCVALADLAVQLARFERPCP